MQAEKEQDRWKVITLADTVDWMLSEDYKKRLKAEKINLSPWDKKGNIYA